MKRQEQQRPQFKVRIICKIGLTVKVKVELNHEKWVFENTFESVKVKVNGFPIAFCYVFSGGWLLRIECLPIDLYGLLFESFCEKHVEYK